MKKIIIFTSIGGGGHVIVSDALTHYLANYYTIEAVPIFSEAIKSLDLIRTLTFGKYDWIKFYNDLLARKQFRILNTCQLIGSWYMRLRRKPLAHILTNYLKEHKADMAISVVPLLNGALIDSAKTLGIPLLIVPTDLDASMVINGIKEPRYSHLKLAYAFDDKELLKTIEPAHLNKNQLTVTGFPLRPNFFNHKNIHHIKAEYDIPSNKPVILLLMGYQGSHALFSFTKELTKLAIPVHLLICTGKDEKMVKKIRNIAFPPHISHTIIGFTRRIADLMAVSDLFIAKSGSVSVCEAMYMNLPLFLDATTNVLRWESFNHTFITKHNFGKSINSITDIVPSVTQFFTDDKYRDAIETSLKSFEKKHAGHEIRKLVAQMLK